MKNYIIHLANYKHSLNMANRALMSAHAHGWDAELWPGVDGATVSFEDLQTKYNIGTCQLNKKCFVMVKDRPGVRGCFLSHWKLWNLCRNQNSAIGIFEHDVEFLKPPKLKHDFKHLLKLEGFNLKSARPAGRWYEGARAYILQPEGADRLLRWVQANGCLPADVNIGMNVVKIDLQDKNIIGLQHENTDKSSKHSNSFTWNLNNMERE